MEATKRLRAGRAGPGAKWAPKRKSYCMMRSCKLLEGSARGRDQWQEGASEESPAGPQDEVARRGCQANAQWPPLACVADHKRCAAQRAPPAGAPHGAPEAAAEARRGRPRAAQRPQAAARAPSEPPAGRRRRRRLATRGPGRGPGALGLAALWLGAASLVWWAAQPSAAQQYRPQWAHKSLEQEIFLLNLEDGYFGCQVNASQDFLQLFELSRLCDGQAHCYLGTDELEAPLKCGSRARCSSRPDARGRHEPVSCANGVCLDGLCYCNDGFGGRSCDIPDENECKFRPCDVFAHCTNTMGSYYCSCFPGYDGDGIHCQDINECEIPSLRALCADNSDCVNLPGHFVCKCKPGYQQSDQSQSSLAGAPIGNTTVQCTDIDECLDERSCGKGANCENLPGSFRCTCPPGFTGDPAVECIDMDECRNNPCGLGAQCTNLPGGYRCSCAPGFERNPVVPASLFGTILTTASPQPAELIEQQQQQQQQQLVATNGSIGGQLTACLDINECATSGQSNQGQVPVGSTGKPSAGGAVCGIGAQCVNTPGAYFCQCPTGYTGNPKVACVDIDECASYACGSNAQCINTAGNFKCECKTGFTGNAYSPEGCQDVDECLRKDACGLNAQCFNTLGGFQCTCQSGFSGDPYTKCQDIDECSPVQGSSQQQPCGPGAQCQNLVGGYRCACPDKYLARGTPEMGCERAAVDIGCSADFECTQNAQCVNATCQCKLGFQTSGIECVDVDECAVSLQQQQQQQHQSPTTPVKAFTRLSSALASANNTGPHLAPAAPLVSALCGPEASCHNTEGSYWCECKAGYEKVDLEAGPGPTTPTSTTISKCRDVNECERSQPCGPNSSCFNTEGSYKCACNDGFIPIDQEPANGCKSPCEGVNCGQHATCKPHGEEAACVCKPGFTFDPNNIKLGCVDINECDPNYGPSGLCGQRAQCINEPGSYKCQCPAGYQGDAYRLCEDINECDRKFGIFGQCGELAVCTNKPGSFSCQCAPGYQGDPRVRCQDVDECSAKLGPSGRCGLNAVCTNLPGRFSCQCPPGYLGDPMDRCRPERPSCASSQECAPNELCQQGLCQCPFGQPSEPTGPQANASQAACRHPCEKTECGPNATCQLDSDNQALCVCDSGYMAPSDGRSGCIDVNECIQGLTLSGVTPISALTSGSGSVALGPQLVTSPPTANSANTNSTAPGHPCGRNALCHNLPGGFDCVCPPGHSGNAYESCTLDVRNQQQHPTSSPNLAQTPTATTASGSNQTSSSAAPALGAGGDPFGQYQQEPRTTACSESCPRGQMCLEGQCVRPDSCRDNSDCKQQQACEQVNQQLGFQCVSVCDLGQCGPEAKCSGQNHKPVCSCNQGFAGDPYDVAHGCQRLATMDNLIQQKTTIAVDDDAHTQSFNLMTTKQQEFTPQRQPTTTQTPPNRQQDRYHDQHQQQHQTGGDISTVSLMDYQTTQPNSRPTQTTISALANTGHQNHLKDSSSATSSTSSMDQFQRQQVLDQQQALHSSKRPGLGQQGNETPLVAYELPLPTTPILPQFETTFATTNGGYSQNTRQNITTTSLGQQQSSIATGQQQQFSSTSSISSSGTSGTTTPNFSRQQQQQTSTTSTPVQQNLATTKRAKPNQPLMAGDSISGNNNNVRQEYPNNVANDGLAEKQGELSLQQQQQQQQQQHYQTSTTTTTKSSQLQQQVQQEERQTQFDSGSAIQQQANANNKTSNFHSGTYLANLKQIACTSDQHCPGNLFCLSGSSQPFGDEHQLEANHQVALVQQRQQQHQQHFQRVCGCPAGYRREADYCYLNRVNCSSSSMCKAREECINLHQLRQQYHYSSASNGGAGQSTISQQFALGNGANLDDSLALFNGNANGLPVQGVCICPRGYKLSQAGLACLDRNECDEGTPCAIGAICQNKIGSYECVCPPGTLGEPYTKTCEPLASAKQHPNQQQTSQEHLECQSNLDCANDRECDQTAHRCVSPCRICGPRAICTATQHTAICLCPPRFTGNAIDLVYGCQEPPATTTSSSLAASTAATTGRPAAGASSPSPVGVASTTLLPSLGPLGNGTSLGPAEQSPAGTTPESVEFRTIPPSELFVMCLADGIQVELQLGGFDGIIYVKGHSQDPKCRKLVQSSSSSEFVDFKVQFGHCDLVHRDGEAGFVLVIQKHPKLVTYRARAYHVKCVYNTGERTVTLGFNVSMITTSGTIANTGPPPTCLMSITALDGREVSSAEIGQDLLLRVDVQPDSIYGGFARSCEAKTMDDEGEYQYEVTDANGCATDASIFSDWKYDQQRKSLVARFNAFKFPSSNNLRFQCNIRVCFGSCPAASCSGSDAYGRRRRRRRAVEPAGPGRLALAGSNATARDQEEPGGAAEEDQDQLVLADTFKDGALREEIRVQSNAILTFERKEEEASLARHQRPPVDEIELVCLPRLGLVLSVGLTVVLAMSALAMATSCWCFAGHKRPNQARPQGPLPHPLDFPNPLMRSPSASTLQESLYGPA